MKSGLPALLSAWKLESRLLPFFPRTFLSGLKKKKLNRDMRGLPLPRAAAVPDLLIEMAFQALVFLLIVSH